MRGRQRDWVSMEVSRNGGYPPVYGVYWWLIVFNGGSWCLVELKNNDSMDYEWDISSG